VPATGAFWAEPDAAGAALDPALPELESPLDCAPGALEEEPPEIWSLEAEVETPAKRTSVVELPPLAFAAAPPLAA
jgi:hypothetical protein